MDTLTGLGLACIIGACVGGGLKAFNVELPVILNSYWRQILLFVLGCFFIYASSSPTAQAIKTALGFKQKNDSGFTIQKINGDSQRIKPGEWKNFEVKVFNSDNVPASGVKVAWFNPQLGEKVYVGLTDPLGFTSATNIYNPGIQGVYFETATIVKQDTPVGITAFSSVTAISAPVTFSFTISNEDNHPIKPKPVTIESTIRVRATDGKDYFLTSFGNNAYPVALKSGDGQTDQEWIIKNTPGQTDKIIIQPKNNDLLYLSADTCDKIIHSGASGKVLKLKTLDNSDPGGAAWYFDGDSKSGYVLYVKTCSDQFYLDHINDPGNHDLSDLSVGLNKLNSGTVDQKWFLSIPK